MNKCQSCGFENADENKFCKKCGAKIETEAASLFCKYCGKETKPGTRFCTGCGQPLEMTAKACTPEKQLKTEPAVNETQTSMDAPAKKKKTWLILVVAGVIVVIALILGIGFAMSGALGTDKEDDPAGSEKHVSQEENENENENEDSVSEEVVSTEMQIDLESTEADTEDGGEVNTNVNRNTPIPVPALVSASSAFDDAAYAVSSLTDGSANTAWGEGVKGLGEGEYIVCRFGEEKDIFGIAILPGNLNSVADFYRYACPTELLVTAGGKEQSVKISNFFADIKDIDNPYLYLELEEPVHTSEIMVSIADAREGTEVETTCIAELHAYTYPSTDSKEKFSVDAWKVSYQEVSDYILPESNTRYLELSDLEGMTAEECRLARNELYARHGRKFDDEYLQAYFESKEWYEGTIDAKDFDESVLNEYEFANRDLIVEYETEQGYR